MIEYKKLYPTIGELIKGKNYDYVSYRITIPEFDDADGILLDVFLPKTEQLSH